MEWCSTTCWYPCCHETPEAICSCGQYPKIEVHTSDRKTLHGFLGLYDDAIGISTAVSFCLERVYTMDTSYPRGKLKHLSAYGCASDGTLMGANCSPLVFENEVLVSDCKITETWRANSIF